MKRTTAGEKPLSIERDVSEILAHFEERRPDKWGEQARRVSEGIRQSGLAEQVDASILSLAAVVGVASSVIAGEISKSNGFLDEIAGSVKNPLATAAGERFRRGINALNHGWWADAILEFTYSVDPVSGNPYFALAHALLGQAHLGAQDPENALASLKRAIHYSTPEEPHITTGCALLASKVLEELHRIDEASSLIVPVARAHEQCPETSLVAARLSNDGSLVKQALWLAPELALAAVTTDTPSAVLASDDLVRIDDGPTRQVVRIANALERLRSETYPSSGVPSVPPGVANLETLPTPEALRLAGEVLQGAGDLARQASRAVEQASYEDERRVHHKASLNESYRRASATLYDATSGRIPGRVLWGFFTALNVLFWTLVVASFFWGPVPAFIVGGLGGVLNAIFTVYLLMGYFTRDKFDVAALERSHRAAWLAFQDAPVPGGDHARRAGAAAEIRAIAELRSSRLRPWSASGIRDD